MRLATQIAVTLSDATKKSKAHAKTGPANCGPDIVWFINLKVPRTSIFYLKILQTDTFIQMFRRLLLTRNAPDTPVCDAVKSRLGNIWKVSYRLPYRQSYRQDAVPPLSSRHSLPLQSSLRLTVTVVLSTDTSSFGSAK